MLLNRIELLHNLKTFQQYLKGYHFLEIKIQFCKLEFKIRPTEPVTEGQTNETYGIRMESELDMDDPSSMRIKNE